MIQGLIILLFMVVTIWFVDFSLTATAEEINTLYDLVVVDLLPIVLFATIGLWVIAYAIRR